MRIGIIDLDTSHPPNWTPIEREMGHEVVGVYDAGAVHPRGFVEEFARQHNISRVFGSLGEMVDQVDCVIIHGCDWDTHVPSARPFIEAGKSVLIDKPMAGNVRDLWTIRDWARSGARITGGSSLRFCAETIAWLEKPVAERGRPHTAFCGCGADEFNYAIHAYSLLTGILGDGAAAVRHLGRGGQRRIEVQYPDGRAGLLSIGPTERGVPFHAAIVAERSAHQFIVDNKRLYRSLLGRVLPYLAGERNDPPLTPDALIEPELVAVAALKSWSEGDRLVRLSELTPGDRGYDGPAFAAEYRREKYPAGGKK